jgi:histidinol-phosphate aminotransferase
MKTASRFDNFPPYTPIEPFEVLSQRLGLPPEQIVKLDANENPYGPSPRARAALGDLAWAHIYPDPENRALRTALADFTGLPADNLFPGAGADELIDLVLRVLLEPGDRVLNFPPTFGMYPFDTRLNAGQVLEIQRRADFSLDLPAVLKAVDTQHPKVLFLTTPNNPDGSLAHAEDIQSLLDLPLLVVVDEAYIEFTENAGRLGEACSLLSQVLERENLVVLRTFSKWAGLAGLRVGYGAFPHWLMPTLWKAKQPYNVNVAASAAAIASLQDADYLAGNVEKLRQERTRLYTGLQSLPYLLPFPSQANFILCQVTDRPALALKEALAAAGILVRYYHTPLLQNFIRVSVGRPQDTDALLQALASLQDGSTPLQRIPPRTVSAIEPSDPTSTLHSTPAAPRTSRVVRRTGETNVEVSLSLDGSGKHIIQTGLPFLDHMLAQIAVHGLFDLDIHAQGDLEIDPHHTTEDVGLALGQAFSEALGARQGIVRMASFEVPMDESLARVTLDFSGRPYAVIEAVWTGPSIGTLPTSLIPHFLESFAIQARCNLHGQVFYGRDDHHKAEALFKAMARALDAASRLDPRRAGGIPSSKGTL